MWVMITLYHILIILDTYQYFTDIGTSLEIEPEFRPRRLGKTATRRLAGELWGSLVQEP